MKTKTQTKAPRTPQADDRVFEVVVTDRNAPESNPVAVFRNVVAKDGFQAIDRVKKWLNPAHMWRRRFNVRDRAAPEPRYRANTVSAPDGRDGDAQCRKTNNSGN